MINKIQKMNRMMINKMMTYNKIIRMMKMMKSKKTRNRMMINKMRTIDLSAFKLNFIKSRCNNSWTNTSNSILSSGSVKVHWYSLKYQVFVKFLDTFLFFKQWSYFWFFVQNVDTVMLNYFVICFSVVLKRDLFSAS